MVGVGDAGILLVVFDTSVRSCCADLFSCLDLLLILMSVKEVEGVWIVLVLEINFVWYLPQMQLTIVVVAGAGKKCVILWFRSSLIKQELGLKLGGIGRALLFVLLLLSSYNAIPKLLE